MRALDGKINDHLGVANLFFPAQPIRIYSSTEEELPQYWCEADTRTALARLI